MNIKLIAVSPRVTKPIGKEALCMPCADKDTKKEIVSPLPTKINAIMRKKAIMNIHVSTRRKMKIPSWKSSQEKRGHSLKNEPDPGEPDPCAVRRTS